MKDIKMVNINKIDLYEWIILLPIIWAFSGQLLTSDAYKAMIAMSIVSLAVSVWRYGYNTIIDNIANNRWIQIIGIMLISSIFYKEYSGAVSSGVLRAYAIMLISLICLPKALTHKLLKNLHWLLLISSLTMLTYTILNMYHWGNPRALWDINPIPYTTISSAVAISSLCYFLTSTSKEIRNVSLITLIFSFNALVIGLSRGPFLALLCSMFITIIFIHIKKSLNYSKLLSAIFVMLLSITINSSLVTERVKTTEESISTVKAGGTDSSIGARLELWKSSTHLILEYPILGLGNKEKLYREELANNGIIAPSTTQWSHYHNQYIDTFVKQGFLGLFLLILLVVYPLTQIKYLDTLPASIILGILSTFWVAALTDNPMNNAQPLIVFLALISLVLQNIRKV
ncbi:O-antigen ligase family protein [Vibrio splendidus]|uniref:O-antigen ligase family protein n=1 Tax=Vibrio splendidus TaxID=29497 RepID=UPI0024697403|nr:O-antigen ligase family protein [Vibrio splendidus]MDH5905162.1 O-antigen ligase family protein [Vibrio splendidus]